MSDDHDLRSRLEHVASSAGDPPEHGLERVTARRRRRLRRRRGAVATAAVLAVLAGTTLIIRGREDRRQPVTASETAPPRGAPAEVPRLVEVHCDPTGIVVPVASVRPERDGLHIRVHNALAQPAKILVESDRWSSGDISVPRGVHDVVQPVPPGQLAIGCEIGGVWQRRHVDLVDPERYYRTPELDCDEAERTVRTDVPVEPSSRNLIAAARAGLEPILAGGGEDVAVGPPRGYPAQRLSHATEDPVVQAVRGGDVIALVHVRGADGAATSPWTTLTEVEVCRPALEPADGDEAPEDTTTTTEPRETRSEPPE